MFTTQQVSMLNDIIRSRVLFFSQTHTPHETTLFLSNEQMLLTLFLEMTRPPITITLPDPIMWEPVTVRPTEEQINHAIIQSDDNGSCVICQENHTDIQLRNCSHRFHESCIRPWFETSVRCPTCRNDIRTTTTNTDNGE